jgi:hypothetical protein
MILLISFFLFKWNDSEEKLLDGNDGMTRDIGGAHFIGR